MKPRRRLGYEYLLALIGVKVAFFLLLWIDVMSIELPGYRIPDATGDAIRALGTFGDLAAADAKAWSLWALYLIPLGTTLGFFGELIWWRRGKDSRWVRAVSPLCSLVAGLVVAIFFFGLHTWALDAIGFAVGDVEWSDIPWDIFGHGLYATAVFTAASAVTVFTVRPSKE